MVQWTSMSSRRPLVTGKRRWSRRRSRSTTRPPTGSCTGSECSRTSSPSPSPSSTPWRPGHHSLTRQSSSTNHQVITKPVEPSLPSLQNTYLKTAVAEKVIKFLYRLYSIAFLKKLFMVNISRSAGRWADRTFIHRT